MCASARPRPATPSTWRTARPAGGWCRSARPAYSAIHTIMTSCGCGCAVRWHRCSGSSPRSGPWARSVLDGEHCGDQPLVVREFLGQLGVAPLGGRDQARLGDREALAEQSEDLVVGAPTAATE